MKSSRADGSVYRESRSSPYKALKVKTDLKSVFLLYFSENSLILYLQWIRSLISPIGQKGGYMKARSRRVGPIPQSKKQLADKWLICPNCRKTIGQLLASGLIISSRKSGALCANCLCELMRGKPARKLSDKARNKLLSDMKDLVAKLMREISR